MIPGRRPKGEREEEKRQFAIALKKVAIVEGRDQAEFVEAMLHHLDHDLHLRLASEIEVRDYGSVGELPKYLDAFTVTPNFESVESLAVLRDAEGSAESAFQAATDALRRHGLPAPAAIGGVGAGKPSIRVFIFPDGQSPGMLETLCLRAVKDEPAFPCVDAYFNCIRQRGVEPPKNIDKAKAQAFLASRREFRAHLGEAARTGYWNWNSPVFGGLKAFLQAL